ncbi:MAG: hypothetical protein ACLQCB_08260, partial [Spirochaetia bacterium]
MKSILRFLPPAVLVMVLVACASLGGGGIGIGDVMQLGKAGAGVVQAEQTEFTPEQEYYIGRAVAANILATRKVYDNK